MSPHFDIISLIVKDFVGILFCNKSLFHNEICFGIIIRALFEKQAPNVTQVVICQSLSVCLQICFWMISLIWTDQLYSNSTRVSLVTGGRPLFVAKRSVIKVTCHGNLCLHTNFFLDDNFGLD